MIKRIRHICHNFNEDDTILIFYYHPINTILKIFKNDLPISISINVYYGWGQNEYSHRNNDLPCFIDIRDESWYIFNKFNIPYRYSGYADMFLINNTKRLKFNHGICLEELKRSIDYD